MQVINRTGRLIRPSPASNNVTFQVLNYQTDKVVILPGCQEVRCAGFSNRGNLWKINNGWQLENTHILTPSIRFKLTP